MKIAYATIYDTKDITRGSGWPYYLTREIENQGHTVHYIGPLKINFPFLTKFWRYINRKINKRYSSYQDPFVGKEIGQKVSDKLNDLDYDVLVTNDYAIAGYTNISKPVVLYTDDMFPYKYSENINPLLGNLSGISAMFCQHTIRRGLQQADICVFPAHFAVEEALKYKVKEIENLKVIPWGANIDHPTEHIAINRNFSKVKSKGYIDLLFVGKDWTRKGGDVAVNTVKELNSRGINANLHIVGYDPSYSTDLDYIKLYGLLNKTKPEDAEQLHKLFSKCDVFILPSVAEGYGLVFVEAAAYGLPSLAYDTTGVTTAVKNGESGILLEPGLSEIAFANVLESWFVNPSSYDRLVYLSRKHFENMANWKIAVTKLISQIEECLQ